VFDLKGKVAIVTGSSRGIGAAIAHALARADAKVVVSSRKADACEIVASEIAKAGGEAIAIPCHIGRREECQALIDKTRAKWQKVDVLVCNAAINPYFGPMTGLSDEVFDKVMQTNVRSNLWLANMVQPEMAARRDGVIIIVSSIGGLKGTDSLGIYAISKAADMQLARNLAVEWGKHNIRVNCIAPGLVRTDFARALWENPELAEASAARTALNYLGEPDDIAGAAVFLAARSGNWITGQTIVIDGGRTIA
jgi:NAD(P)-dependent dehydrogenase (short-subunit alcohol dehydrogenase family)